MADLKRQMCLYLGTTPTYLFVDIIMKKFC